ncbi:MAG: DUF5666 domain-containing protein [Nitrospiria bacterium]
MKNVIKSLLPVFFIGILSHACGSGGVGGTGITAGGGIGGTGISEGTVTGFGSVIVNGVAFNTDGAEFTIDDAPGTQSGLAVGMVVRVLVGEDGVTATQVVYEAEVEGPVDSRDPATNSLVALGRTVIVDDSTKFEGTSGFTGADPLADNDKVEVSGLVFDDDRIQATFIRRVPDTGVDLELKGRVTGLSNPTSTFSIGSQVVDFSFVTITLANGKRVEVKGTRSGANLIASSIEIEDDTLGGKENDNVELEGMVTVVTAPIDVSTGVGAFSVGPQAVITGAGTRFEDGAPDDLVKNVRLEVEGSMNAGGVLVARTVKFHGDRIKIEANVEAVNETVTPATVVILGKTVVINRATGFEEKTSPPDPFSSVADISVGDRLEIRAYLSNGVITATRVERDNNKQGDPVRFQAPVDSIAGSDLILLGVRVDTSGVLDLNFKDRRDVSIGRVAFFSQVKADDLVKAKGSLVLGDIDAEEVEFE